MADDGIMFNAPETPFGTSDKDIKSGARAAASPEELYQLLYERFESAQRSKYWVERQWVINTAHYINQPNVGFDRRTGAVAVVPKDHPSRVRISIPIISYLIDTRKARIMRATPDPVVLPASSDDEDRYKAKLATKIVKYLFEKHEFDTTLSEQLILYADIMSAGFVKVTFNPLAGDTFLEIPSETEPGKVEYIPEGEISVEAVGPFEIFPDPGATDLKTCKWVIQAKEIPVVDALRLFPNFEEQIKTADQKSEQSTFFAGGGFNVLYDFPQFSQVNAGKFKDRMVLYEMWERATPEYPTGRHVIAIDKVVVLDEATPEEYDEIPYEMVSSMPVPGRFWPIAVTELLVGPQIEYNRRRSQITENLNAHAWLRMISPRGALINTIRKDAIHLLEYDPKMAMTRDPVKYLDVPAMPSDAFRQLAEIKQDMEEIAGVHDVSRGQDPSGARTGRAMWFLQEADDTRLERVVQRYHKAAAGAATRALKIARNRYTTKKIFQTFSPKDIEVMEFVGSELGENTRVIIDPRAKAPLSMTQRIDLFMNMWEQNVFMDATGMARDPKKLLELLNLQDTDSVFEPDSLHTQRARKENMLFRQGQPIPDPGQYENDEIHLKEHREETLQDRWLKTPPELQQLLLQHIFTHEIRQLRTAEFMGQVPPGSVEALLSGQPVGATQAVGPDGEPAPNEARGGEEQVVKPDVGDRGLEKTRDGLPGQIPNPPNTPTGQGQTASNY